MQTGQAHSIQLPLPLLLTLPPKKIWIGEFTASRRCCCTPDHLKDVGGGDANSQLPSDPAAAAAAVPAVPVAALTTWRTAGTQTAGCPPPSPGCSCRECPGCSCLRWRQGPRHQPPALQLEQGRCRGWAGPGRLCPPGRDGCRSLGPRRTSTRRG